VISGHVPLSKTRTPGRAYPAIFGGVVHVLVEDALKRRKTVSVFSFQLQVKNELKTENCFSEES
jgi:hypothetical protein